MKIKIKPAAGMKVIKPDSKLALKSEGEEVIQDSYWLRRLADGDVLLMEDDKQAQPAKAKKSENEGGLK